MPSTHTRDLASKPKHAFPVLVTLSFIVAALLLPTSFGASLFSSGHFALPHFALLPAVFADSAAGEYWHTTENRILDAHDQPVRISGLNWSGFETTNGVVGGLELQDYRAILRTMRANGFNTVRIPLSNEMVESPSIPEHIAFSNARGSINGDLKGLDSMEILDHIVAEAGKTGLKVILDDHRSEAGSSAEENGLWYTPHYPESSWIADWVMLARRYKGNPTVIGVDLRNEPHNAATGGACWDCGGANDWHLAAQRAGNAVLRVNPRLLIFIEGVDEYRGSVSWWGGNLAGVRQSPVRLQIPGHLVYSAHVYGPAEYQQPWFNAQTSPATLAELFRHQWAFISESGIAPVWVGEFGTPNEEEDVQSDVPGSEGQWFAVLVGFLRQHPQIGWTYWGANGEDRYGLLDASYGERPASASKALALASITSGVSRPDTSAETTARNSLVQRVLSESFALGHTGLTPARGSRRDEAGVTVRPMSKETIALPAAETVDVADYRIEARQQAASAWRAMPPIAAVQDVPIAEARSSGQRRGKTTANVSEAVSEEVRQANAEALRHADQGDQD